MMRVLFLSLLLSVFASTRTEIVLIKDKSFPSGVATTPYISNSSYSTGLLGPGEEAIFWFTIPGDGGDQFALSHDATLNLWADNFLNFEVNFNVRLRKGDDNFDDRDSELKKKTWGEYADSRLYTCEVETSKTYYVQVENPTSNTFASALDISLDVDNDGTCESLADLGDFFGELFGSIFLGIFIAFCAVVALVAIICVCCICNCVRSNRNTALKARTGPPGQQPAPHPFYNPVNEPAEQTPQAQADPEAQIPYSGNPPPSSEAMTDPLMPAYAEPTAAFARPRLLSQSGNQNV